MSNSGSEISDVTGTLVQGQSIAAAVSDPAA